MLVFTGVHIFLLFNGEFFQETQPNPDATSFCWRHFPNPKSQKHVFLGRKYMWMLPRKKLGGSPPFERMYVEENSFLWLQGKNLKTKTLLNSVFLVRKT